MNLFSEFHVYASRDPNAQPVATATDAESARATCRALAWKSGRNHFVVEKLMSGQNAEIFSAADIAELAAVSPGSSLTAGIAELADASACASLTAKIEALIRETIRLEEHEENPGEWGVWAVGGDVDEPELMGAGPSRRAALEDALETAKGWASAVEVSS